MRKLKKAELPRGHYFAEFMLFVVTFLWSSTFVFVKWAIDPHIWIGKSFTPNLLITYRFTIASFLFILWKPSFLKDFIQKNVFWGVFLGALLYIAYLSQTFGLKYTTASKGAFITALALVFVPFLSISIERQLPKVNSIIGCFIALVGLYLLLNPFATKTSINVGDFLCLICSIMWGLYIVILSKVSKDESKINSLIFSQFFTITILCWIYLIFSGEKLFVPELKLSGLILYLGIFCTFFTTFLQTTFQRRTNSIRAALIFTTEPLIVTGLAFIMMGETLSTPQIIGGLLIVWGVIFSEIF